MLAARKTTHCSAPIIVLGAATVVLLALHVYWLRSRSTSSSATASTPASCRIDQPAGDPVGRDSSFHSVGWARADHVVATRERIRSFAGRRKNSSNEPRLASTRPSGPARARTW